MASTAKWKASGRGTGGLETLLTTGLNSIANNAGVLSAAIAQTELDMYADFEFVVAHGSAPAADTTWDLYLVRQIDGTNYEDQSASRPPANGAIGSFVMDATSSAQRHVIAGVLLPPVGFKVLIVNKSGQTSAASSNTLKMFAYNQQVV